MSTFGDRFRKERSKKKLTQEQLGNMFHVGKSSISRYESGQQRPETDLLNNFADYFGVTVDYLLNGSKEESDSATIYTKQDYDRFNKYNSLSDNSKKIVDLLIEELLNKKEK